MTWDLRLGDCLDPLSGLASLADKSVDHVITDPPYSKDLYLRFRSGLGKNDRRRDSTDFRQLANDKIGAIDDILAEIAAHALRVARRWVVVFHDVEIGHRWREAFGKAYVRAGVWVKTDAVPQFSGDRPGQGYEPNTIAHALVPGRKRWNGGGRCAVWTGPSSHGFGEVRPDHPCPKPEWLMSALVRDFTDPGELICDPFAGSGTTLVAAKRHGRSAIGWERDPGFHAAALKRIDGTQEQLTLLRPERRREKQIDFPTAAPAADEQ